MKTINSHVRQGLSLRKARQLWRRVGGTVVPKRGTGEDVYVHPQIARPIVVRVPGRAKDTPRRLILALRYLLVEE